MVFHQRQAFYRRSSQLVDCQVLSIDEPHKNIKNFRVDANRVFNGLFTENGEQGGGSPGGHGAEGGGGASSGTSVLPGAARVQAVGQPPGGGSSGGDRHWEQREPAVFPEAPMLGATFVS